ncbi:MAG: rubrerythrin family protein [Lentisphaeria bacterium]|nr:rubrerythrin family protein [Lentisphaeria bacterium]
MSKLKGTQTEVNLLKSFAGESQARNRYTFFASQAKKENLMQISSIFAETADQEKEHAERFFKFLEGGELEITATFPAGLIRSTEKNLAHAADGEYDEWHNLYPAFADIARKEGLDKIADVWEHVIISEKQHEKRYRELLGNIEKDQVFRRDRIVVWKCRNCGYLHVAYDAPKTCPACAHDRGYFELNAENW